jgi:DNA-binding MarR family transcriptional regulator
VDILKRNDNGEARREIARSLELSRSTVSTTVKRIENYGTCKSAGTLESIMVNQKRSVVIEEMKHLLKIWLNVQAQRRITVSQAIISDKAKSLKFYKVLYEEKKAAAVQLKLDQFFTKQPIKY